ncbi:TraI/MobA(P) family conjugative relaxase [Bilophila wadsworthia]
MIASRKRMNDSSKSSITRLISYLTNTQGSSQRVGEVRISGCEAEEAGWAAMEMLATQQQNTRAKGDKTYHLVLSFHENLPSRDIAEIERRVCEAIGLGEHQRVSVMHNDTENPHLHIAINKIHPQKLTMIEPYYDEKTLARVCVQLEKEFGLVADNHEPRAQGRSSAATSMERAGDMESLTGWIQRNCLSALKEAKDWRAFGKVLAEHGLSLEERKNGFVLTDGKVHVKASSVAYGLSRARLEKRLGNFEGLEQRERANRRNGMSGSRCPGARRCGRHISGKRMKDGTNSVGYSGKCPDGLRERMSARSIRLPPWHERVFP